MDYARAFYLLGRLGARNTHSWETCVATWIDDGKGLMPTEQQCADILASAAKLDLQSKADAECHLRIKTLTGDTSETWPVPQLNRLASFSDDVASLLILSWPKIRQTLSAEDVAKGDALVASIQTKRATWGAIVALRTKCATLKASIEAGTITAEDQIKDAVNWQ